MATDPQPLWDWTGLTAAVEKTPAPTSPIREKATEEGDKGSEGQGEKGQREGEKGQGEKENGEKGREGKGQRESRLDPKDRSGSGKQGVAEAKPRESHPPISLPALGLGPLAGLLKAIVIAVIVVIVVIILARAGLHFLANFTDWAKHLLKFFAKFKFGVSFVSGPEERAAPRTYRSFASFASPFGNGKEIDMTPGELVRYSFAALHAWGREQNLARSPGETALEFARRISSEYPGLGHEAVQLAALYARLAYSTDTFLELDPDSLRAICGRM